MLLIAHPVDVADEAAWLTEAERVEGVRRARAGLDGDGAAECAGCGDEIDPARRAALPSATRCVACQSRLERGARGRAGAPVIGGASYPERAELGGSL